MNDETETLRNRIKLLEDENAHLKQLLREAGIEVVLLSDCHQHFAVIDRSTVWYGSMNLLGKEESEDNIMRIVSEELADEVLELGFGLNSRVDS